MKLYFIRHGQTAGNREGRYVGRTDEPLLPESIEALKQENMPPVDMVITSPMRRCVETAEALYPGKAILVKENLREIDFGEFEYKNYQELKGNPFYQAYIDSGGTTDFPGGEPLTTFRERCKTAFAETVDMLESEGIQSAAFVVHGGTIMSILEAYGVPARGYFDWQIRNGQCLWGLWQGDKKVLILQETENK